MLFDLRGRGRRRTVQAIYLFLAVLIGGGLVFFGVGGTGVGLFNTDNSAGGGGSGNGVLEKQLTRAARGVKLQPRDPGRWAKLAQVRFSVAGAGDNYDSVQGAYKPNGRKELRAATQAWKRYLDLKSGQPDAQLAAQMSNAFRELQDAKGLVGTLEVLVEQTPSSQLFLQLALASYAAKQDRKGDLAAAEALKRTPKGSRQQVKAQLDAAKSQIKQRSTTPVPQTSTVPVAPKAKG